MIFILVRVLAESRSNRLGVLAAPPGAAVSSLDSSWLPSGRTLTSLPLGLASCDDAPVSALRSCCSPFLVLFAMCAMVALFHLSVHISASAVSRKSLSWPVHDAIVGGLRGPPCVRSFLARRPHQSADSARPCLGRTIRTVSSGARRGTRLAIPGG